MRTRTGEPLGEACRACGADEWIRENEGRPNTVRRCVPCLRRKKARNQRALRLRRGPAYAVWRGANTRAKKRGIPFTITVEDVRDAWPADNRCPVLGLALTVGKKTAGGSSPSLDRLVGEWGYTKQNIAVVSFRANTLKSDARVAELEQVVAWMRKKGLA